MPVESGLALSQLSPALARPSLGRLQPHHGHLATSRAAPPGASLHLPRAVLEIQKRIFHLHPCSLQGSVYPSKYLMVIGSRGREPAPAPGGVTRASRDMWSAETRRTRQDGRRPSLAETLSAPSLCYRFLQRHAGKMGDGRAKPQGRPRLQASPVPRQKLMSSFPPQILGRGRNVGDGRGRC